MARATLVTWFGHLSKDWEEIRCWEELSCTCFENMYLIIICFQGYAVCHPFYFNSWCYLWRLFMSLSHSLTLRVLKQDPTFTSVWNNNGFTTTEFSFVRAMLECDVHGYQIWIGVVCVRGFYLGRPQNFDPLLLPCHCPTHATYQYLCQPFHLNGSPITKLIVSGYGRTHYPIP